MPAALAIPLITGAIGAGTSLVSAKMQSNAVKDSSELQAEGTQKALDFTKAEKNALTARLKPYVDAGTSASGFAQKLLGASPYVAAMRPQAPVAGAPPQGQVVTVKAPDGSTRQFAANDPMVALAQQKGAQIVDGGAPPPASAGYGYSPAAMAARI